MDDYAIVPRQEEETKETQVEMKSHTSEKTKQEGKSSTSSASKAAQAPVPAGWSPHGLPVGDPRGQRAEWDSGICSCLGKNDEFHSSDVEVCVMGCCAPCVLHGSNVERLRSDPTSFAAHCLPYAGLYLIGNCLFGWNCLAPWLSYPNRTAIRRKFNLEGCCEVMARSHGCTENIRRMEEDQREHCETACDMATHVLCHPCSLCQETRELRRRLPHPGFPAKPVIVMLPPAGQAMGR